MGQRSFSKRFHLYALETKGNICLSDVRGLKRHLCLTTRRAGPLFRYESVKMRGSLSPQFILQDAQLSGPHELRLWVPVPTGGILAQMCGCAFGAFTHSIARNFPSVGLEHGSISPHPGRLPRSETSQLGQLFPPPDHPAKTLIAAKDSSILAHFSRPDIGLDMTPNIGHP